MFQTKNSDDLPGKTWDFNSLDFFPNQQIWKKVPPKGQGTKGNMENWARILNDSYPLCKKICAGSPLLYPLFFANSPQLHYLSMRKTASLPCLFRDNTPTNNIINTNYWTTANHYDVKQYFSTTRQGQVFYKIVPISVSAQYSIQQNNISMWHKN